MKLKTKAIIIWCVVISIVFPFTLPVLAYAQTDIPIIEMENREQTLSVAPYENDLGVIVNAEDITGFFGMDYDYDSEDKTFTIHSPQHGEVILSHNATEFKSGENVFECLPYFFVTNGTPMIEVGFFCEMFNLNFDYDDDADKITLYWNVPENQEALENNNSVLDNGVHLMSSNGSMLAGKIKLEDTPKHKTGLKVALVLTPVSKNRTEQVWVSTYGGGGHYTTVTRCDSGTPVNIGDVTFAESEYEKNYSFNVKSDEANPDNYEYYTVGYEVSGDKYLVLNKYGYIDSNQNTYVTSSSPLSGAAGGPYPYKYEYKNNTADITITPKDISKKTAEDYKRNATLIIRDYKKPSYYDVNKFNVLQNGKIYQTDEKGTLYYSGSSSDFKVAADGYQSFTYPLPMEYLKGAYHSKLYIYKESDFESTPKINAIYYNRFNIFGPKGYADSRSYTVGASNETCTITPVVSTKFDECEVTKMSIEQGKLKKEIEVQMKPAGDYNIYSGSTEEIYPGVEFSEDEPIYLVITTDTGETIKEALNIRALEMQPIDVDVDMGDEISMDTPSGEDSILGGSKMKISLFKYFPAEFKVTPTGNNNYDIYGSIGFESKDSNKYYDDVKSGFNAAYQSYLDKDYETKNPVKQFDNFFKKLENMNMKQMSRMPEAEYGWPISLKIFGYVDGTYNLQDNGKYVPAFKESGFGSKFSFGKEITRLRMTSYGPGYWKAGLTFEDTVLIKLRGEDGKLHIPDSVDNTAKVEITAGAGYGLPDLVSIGASGSGEVDFICTIPIDKDSTQVTLSGKINIFDLKFGCYEKSLITLPTPTYQVYPVFMELESVEELLDAETEKAPLQQLPRSYTDSPLVMNVERAELMSADGGETPIIVETIADNTYTFANAQFAELENGDLLAAWVEDDRTRESNADRTGIYYSVKHEGVWSEPVIAVDDTTADFNPKIKKIGDNLYLTWSNMTENFGNDETDITAMASTIETSVATWNGNAFESLGSIGNKGAISSAITEINGIPTVVWTEDQNGDIYQNNNNTSLKMAKYEKGAWKTLELLKGQLAIDGLDITEINGKEVIYYSQDTDKDNTTFEDKEIFVYENGKATQLTSNEIADTKPTATQDGVYWYSDSKIAYQPYGGADMTYLAEGCLGDQFNVSQSDNGKVITYSKSSNDGGTDIWAECFNGEEWGEPIKVLTTDKYIAAHQTLMSKDNSFKVLTSDVTINDDSFGASSINMYDVSPYVDLEMEGVVFNEYSVRGQTEYSFSVKNNGSDTVHGIKVELYSESGSRIGSETFEETEILPGETMDYTASFYDWSSGNKTLTVSPLNATDIDASNNSDTIKINYDVDLAVSNIRDESTTDAIVVGADIINNLDKEISDVTVSLMKDNTMSEPVQTKTVNCTTDYGSGIYGAPVYFEIPNGESGVYYIVCESKEGENLLGNNSSFISATLLSDLPEEVDGAIEFTEDETTVTADFARNTVGDVFGHITAYDENGALLSIQRIAVNDNHVQRSMTKIDGAATYKAFLWNSYLQPLCDAKTITATK